MLDSHALRLKKFMPSNIETPRIDLRNMIRKLPLSRSLWRWMFSKRTAYLHHRAARRQAKTMEAAALKQMLLAVLPAEEQAQWRHRIESVCTDPNNVNIPRHARAGRVLGKYLVMHNGLRIHPMSHYGNLMFQMLVSNRGVHEPEEERAFSQVLKLLPTRPVMLELGSYWAFYSMWFLQACPTGRTFLIEPDQENLEWGRRNYQANRLAGNFSNAFVGHTPESPPDGIPTVSVDGFCKCHDIERIHMLHSDIQGAEHEMLIGAQELLRTRRIDFVFVSTHSNRLHYSCVDFLESMEYVILRNTDLNATTSYDGLIVACTRTIDEATAIREMLSFSQIGDRLAAE